MEEILPKKNKFVLKNSETRFQKAETPFQNAETRFQNTKIVLSCIFFARTEMDSAQKKPVFVLIFVMGFRMVDGVTIIMSMFIKPAKYGIT